jgi:hypothetical protein
MIPLDIVKQAPGVYLMLDLDKNPVYAGQAKNMRKRLREHFINQRSDVLTDVLLDIYEVQSVALWYAVERIDLPFSMDDEQAPDVIARKHPLDVLEAALLREFRPRWNRVKTEWGAGLPVLTLENVNCIIPVVEGKELEVRRDAGQRIETKLLHILRAVRKVRISGGSRTVRWGLTQHINELQELCRNGIR